MTAVVHKYSLKIKATNMVAFFILKIIAQLQKVTYLLRNIKNDLKWE